MHIPSSNSHRSRPSIAGAHTARRLLVVLALTGLLFEPGCIFRKHKPPAAPASPARVRVVLLPMNVPDGSPELHWISLATVAEMADTASAAPDLELVPVWESVPAALQSLGNSRTVTLDIAELVATRLSARWSSQGEIIKAGKTFTWRLDFIPAKPSLVPFRYEKTSAVEALPSQAREAFDQFLRYLIVRPLEVTKTPSLDAKKLREIADALDAEFGWFGTAKPGTSGKVVEDLARSRPALARVLFSPTLYPVLAK